MKNQNGIMIIGVDHGYGNIKTANCCFPTGIMSYDSEPLFTGDMLTYEGRYYLIGVGHKEFLAEKTMDDDYYLLTLVAIARELTLAELTEELGAALSAATFSLPSADGQSTNISVAEQIQDDQSILDDLELFG